MYTIGQPHIDIYSVSNTSYSQIHALEVGVVTYLANPRRNTYYFVAVSFRTPDG